MALKKLLNHAYRYPLLLAVYSLPMFTNLSSGRRAGTADAYFLLNFGGVTGDTPTDLLMLFFKFVPPILMLYLFSTVMLEDCDISYVYVFTRMGSKTRWLHKKIIQIFFQFLTAFLFIFALCLIFSEAQGFLVQKNCAFYVILFSLNFFPMFLLSLLQNIISLRSGATQSFLWVLLFYMIPLLIGILLDNKNPLLSAVITLFPSSSQMVIWHSDFSRPAGFETFFGPPVPGFTILRSILVLSIAFLAVYGVARILIQRRDLTELIKEDQI